jgi:hypothetical protein
VAPDGIRPEAAEPLPVDLDYALHQQIRRAQLVLRL